MSDDHVIRRALAAQHAAARTVQHRGLQHPCSIRLLAAAAVLAAAAWEIGHRVHDTHPAPTDRTKRSR